MTRATIMRTLLLLALAATAGCSQTPTSAQTDPLGRAKNSHLVPRHFQPDWTYDLAVRTEGVVKPRVQYPSTARFDNLPHTEAYYDSVVDRTQLNIYGNVESTGSAGQDVFQGYYVTWELSGDVKTAEQVRDGEWILADVEVLDAQF
jgi:hypothetical protein